MSSSVTLANLKIHKLVDEAQYEQAVANGTIDPNALYLTPSQQADWGQTDSTKDAYIKNKPDLDAEFAPNSSVTIATFNITKANTVITLKNLTPVDAITINWGDGKVNNSLSHEYLTPGTYKCKICNVKSIGTSAFDFCNSLTSVKIGDSVNSIGTRAFARTPLTSVEIGENVMSIGNSAFIGCKATSVEIPNSVESIGDQAFSNCTSLVSVVIPDSVTSIGDRAFSGCSVLTNATLPAIAVSVIPLTNLQTVTITSGELASNAFDGCTSLTSVKIGDSVTSIGSCAFRGCTSLESVYIDDIANWCNITFGDLPANPLTYANNLFLNNKLVTELVIPDTVTAIKNYAFRNCTSLISAVIPNSVNSIGSKAFIGCSNLSELVVKSTISTLGSTDAIPITISRILVPAGSLENYKTATNWVSHAANIFGYIGTNATTAFTDQHLVSYNAAENKFEDCGYSINELYAKAYSQILDEISI